MKLKQIKWLLKYLFYFKTYRCSYGWKCKARKEKHFKKAKHFIN